MGPCEGFPEESSGARGEGLEPSITGPEPVVLPITPPPNGCFKMLAGPLQVASRLRWLCPTGPLEAENSSDGDGTRLGQHRPELVVEGSLRVKSGRDLRAKAVVNGRSSDPVGVHRIGDDDHLLSGAN